MHTGKASQDPVWKRREDSGGGGGAGVEDVGRNLKIDLEIWKSVGNFVPLPI